MNRTAIDGRPSQHPKAQNFFDRKRKRQRAEEKQFDARYARYRVYLLESERARRKALDAIAERDALRLARSDAARRACFIGGVSHGPLDEELGPRDGESLSEFGARVDRETPRLTLADFPAPAAWWSEEPSTSKSIPGSMPALPARRKVARRVKRRMARLFFRGY